MNVKGSAMEYNTPFYFNVRDMNVREFAEFVSTGGFFKAALYDLDKARADVIEKKLGKNVVPFGKKNAQGANVLALDFDSIAESPEKIVEILAECGLLPNFMYWSASQDPRQLSNTKNYRETLCTLYNIYSTQGNSVNFSNEELDTTKAEAPHYKEGFNFRLVWCLSSTLLNKEYEDLYIKLLDWCGEHNIHPDPATKDISRIWWGGTLGCALYTEEPTNLKASFGWQEISKRIAKSNKAQIRHIISAKNEYIGEYRDTVEFPDTVEVESYWWELLRGRCALWDKYEQGEYLDHNQRLHLFTNLKFLKLSDTSNSIFKDIMQFYVPEVWEGHTFDEKQLKSMLQDTKLGAYPCVRTAAGEFITIPAFFKQGDAPRIVKKTNRVSEKELDIIMDKLINETLLSDENNYFQSQTASGKTEHILDFLISQDPAKKYIVALPYLNSIEEFKQRWFAKTDRFLYAMPTDTEYTDLDLARLSLGLGKSSKNPEKVNFIRQLLQPQEFSGGVYVITHALLLNLPYIPCQRIIIDENIEEALTQEYIFTKPQIRLISDYVPEEVREQVDELIWNIDNPEGNIVDLTPLHKILPALESNINEYIEGVPETMWTEGIFNCRKASEGKVYKNGFRVRIKTPLITDALEDGTPITIFTATPLSAQIREDYGETFKIIKAPLAANKGKVIQFTSIKGARGINNSKLLPMYREIKRIMLKRYHKPLKDYYLLTFKLAPELQCEVEKLGFRLPRLNGNQIHIDNCAGLDFLKGKQIIMAAKKDLPPDYYLKKYEDITGEVVEHLPMNWFLIDDAEIHGSCYLYQDEAIRSIQMEYITKMAVQAVGRARALREASATVYYFSDFPIDDVDEIYNI